MQSVEPKTAELLGSGTHQHGMVLCTGVSFASHAHVRCPVARLVTVVQRNNCSHGGDLAGTMCSASVGAQHCVHEKLAPQVPPEPPVQSLKLEPKWCGILCVRWNQHGVSVPS